MGFGVEAQSLGLELRIQGLHNHTANGQNIGEGTGNKFRVFKKLCPSMCSRFKKPTGFRASGSCSVCPFSRFCIFKTVP